MMPEVNYIITNKQYYSLWEIKVKHVALTFRNTPTTASPSGWLAASPKLAYLVFQCTRWS